jgi:MoxR-like ATPase
MVVIVVILWHTSSVGNPPTLTERRKTMSSSVSQCWDDLDSALLAKADRILLYGQPGTGKTHYALSQHLTYGDRKRNSFRVLCSPDMTTADVDGLWKPSKDEWKFVAGSALRAWENGDRLILDELDQASGDVLTALLLICDSDGSAVREHPETGERISPKAGFEIIATTNAERLSDLPANLVDRFPIRININEVNPAALETLPDELRDIARTYANRATDRYSLRSFFAYDKLAQTIDQEQALRLVFPTEWKSIHNALEVAKAMATTRKLVNRVDGMEDLLDDAVSISKDNI